MSLKFSIQLLLILICVGIQTGCATLNLGSRIKGSWTASNERDWRPEQAVMPFVERNQQQLVLRNIRNCNYVTEDDYVVDYYDREIAIDQIRSVDFVVAPFATAPQLAHTMLSFGLDDGSYIAVSVEVRKELGEKFSPILGLAKKFELIYVLGDERDVIRLRIEHHNADVQVYPTIANSKQAQELFINVAQRINKLSVDPEFYNSITNNCTTNLAGHVNEVSPDKIMYGWKVLLPGFSAQYAYELGLLDNRIPFDDLTQVASINQLADQHFDDPDFSQQIRSRRYLLDRYVDRQSRREPTLRSRGDRYLNAQSERPRFRRSKILVSNRNSQNLER